MNTIEYKRLAVLTESVDLIEITKRLNNKGTIRLLHASMGLATESGEFVDQLKRHVFYNKPLDLKNLKEEAGDLLWYLAIALDEIGLSFDEVMEANIAKLKARYPKGFNELDAVNRDLTQEAKCLNQEK